MRKLALGLLIFALSGCAHLPRWEKDWEFDCEWARFWDFQNAARSRAMGMPYWPNQWTNMYCDVDPSSLEYWGRRKKAEEPPPDERRSTR